MPKVISLENRRVFAALPDVIEDTNLTTGILFDDILWQSEHSKDVREDGFFAYANMQKISKKMGMSYHSVRKIMQRLVEKGYIEKEVGMRPNSNLHVVWIKITCVFESEKRDKKKAGQSGKNYHTESGKNYHSKAQENENQSGKNYHSRVVKSTTPECNFLPQHNNMYIPCKRDIATLSPTKKEKTEKAKNKKTKNQKPKKEKIMSLLEELIQLFESKGINTLDKDRAFEKLEDLVIKLGKSKGKPSLYLNAAKKYLDSTWKDKSLNHFLSLSVFGNYMTSESDKPQKRRNPWGDQ